MTQERLKTRRCSLCSAEFPGGPRAKYCPECRRELRHSIASARPKSTPKRSIGEIVAEVTAYNKEHGTHLTYGKYVEKFETVELIKKGRGKKRR